MYHHKIYLFSLLCQALLISNSVASSQVSLPTSWTANITSQLSTLSPIGRPGGQDFIHCCATALSTFANGSDLSEISVGPFSGTSQYPCGATYQGDSAGAPPVKVTYKWCHKQCPGWQVSKAEKLTQWLQPFVGFILPAVIFSLNVPRRRKIQPPAWVFPEDIEKFTSLFKALLCALSAALIVTIDTIVWLCVVFALAGPLLLSGLYEAWIDKRVVDFMSRKNNFDELPLALRSKILIAVLVGNLDLDGAWMSAMDIAEPLERRAATGESTPLWLQIQELEAIVPLPSGPSMRNIPFGSRSGRQNSATGEGVMTSSNSHPNTERQPNPEAQDHELLRKMLPDFGPTYDARYQPQWMINRGRSKREWLFCLIEVHKRQTLSLTAEARVQLNELRETLHMKWGDWMTLIVFAISLFMIPCIFGFLVAYLTPQIGVSCRSFTVLMYATSQIGLLLLWLWDVTWRDEKWRRRRTGAKVYPDVISPNLTIQPPGPERNIENQEVQRESPVNDLRPPHVDSDSAMPVARSHNQLGGRSDDIPLVPIISTTPTTSILTSQPAMTPSQTTSNGNLVQLQGSNSANAADVEAGPVATRHPSEAGTVVPQGLFARTVSFLAKARWTGPHRNGSALSRIGAVVYGVLMALLLSLAVLSSIGGTVMQILGVYRTCLCQINVSNWLWGRDSTFLTASTNTSQDIRLAHHTWIPVGFVAAFFLGTTAYIAWWYQRRLRFRFTLLLGNSQTGAFNNQPYGSGPSSASSIHGNSSGVGTLVNHTP